MSWEARSSHLWLLVMGFTFSGYSIHKWEGFSVRDEESAVAFERPIFFTLRYPWDSSFFFFCFFCFLFSISQVICLASPQLVSLGSSCSRCIFISCVTTIRDIVTYHIFCIGLFCFFLYFSFCFTLVVTLMTECFNVIRLARFVAFPLLGFWGYTKGQHPPTKHPS